MAEIMGYILNLLLLRGKFLTTTAAKTLHKAFIKCLQFKKKISADYKTEIPMIGSFENMMEFINYNSSHYTCEGENYTITSQVCYQLSEDINRMKLQDKNSNSCENSSTIQSSEKKLEELPKNRNRSAKHERMHRDHQKKSVSSEHIVDNLQAILRSQEFCFKNMSKLVSILEKHDILAKSNKKLEQIKQKLIACSDILSNNAHSRKFSSIINNIIEEEITRCRFKNGESKTSAEISLKSSRPQGIEAALETKKPQPKPIHRVKPELSKKKNEVLRRTEISLEAKADSAKFIKKSKSEPVISVSQNVPQTKCYEGVLKGSHISIEDTKKVLEINEEQFHKFENTLWHSLTTLKFMALKDDYLDRCRCAFYNKRQFLATESTIMKKVKQDEANMNKLKKQEADMTELALQTMEQKIFYENVKEEVMKKREEALKSAAEEEENPFKLLIVEPVVSQKNKLDEKHNFEKTVPEKKNIYQTKNQVAQTSPLEDKEGEKKEEKNKSNIELPTRNTTINQEKKERKVNTDINVNDLQKLDPKITEGVIVATVNSENDRNIIESRQKFHTTQSDQETNTIINSFKLNQTEYNQEIRNTENEKVEKLISTLSESLPPQIKNSFYRTQESNVDLVRKSTEIISNDDMKLENPERENKAAVDLRIIPVSAIVIKDRSRDLNKIKKYIPIAEIIKNRSKENKRSKIYSRNRKQDKVPVKKKEAEISKTSNDNVPINTDVEKTGSMLNQDKTDSQINYSVNESNMNKFGNNSKLQTISNTFGKIITLTHGELEERVKISSQKSKSDGDLLQVNKKAFEELEATIRNVRIFISKNPKSGPRSALKTTTENKKRKIDEPPKKCMSTKQLVHVIMQQYGFKQELIKNDKDNEKNKVANKASKYSLSKKKTKTFLKKNSPLQQKEEKDFHSRKNELLKQVQTDNRSKKNWQMRRTTKNAMKRQQVLTIFPNVSKEADEKRKPVVGLVETKETKAVKENGKRDRKVTKGSREILRKASLLKQNNK